MKKTMKIATVAGLAILTISGCTDSDTKTGALKASTRNANFLVDTNGMSLYIFDKDERNKSNCDAKCQEIWPLFEGADSGSEEVKL